MKTLSLSCPRCGWRSVAAAEDLLRLQAQIIDQVHDSVISTDLEGCVTSWNKGAERLSGYTAAEAMGRHISFVYFEDEMDTVERDQIPALMATGKFDSEMRLRRKSGEAYYMHLSLSVLHDSTGAVAGMIGYSMDITERKTAEDGLRETERRLTEAQRIARVGSWDWDVKANTIRWSAEMFRIFELNPAEHEPDFESFQGLFDPEDAPAIAEAIALALATGDPFAQDARLRLPDGKRWIHAQGEVVRDADGQPSRMAGTVQDITHHKRAEEERLALERQVQHAQKMESMGTLAGGIAHDFNNVLTGILGFSELAENRVEPDSVEHKYILEVLTAAERARDLVAQILAFSRQTEGERRPTELAPIVDEVLRLVRAGLPSTIDVRADLQERDMVVHCDPTQVHQILMNLCTNAGHAMPSGGVVELRLERLELDAHTRAVFDDLQPGVYARLIVRDTGTGIEPADMARIFEPYFTTKEVGDGTGLGLAVVHGIVKSMNGDIKTYSELGRGTEFHILLPAVNTRVRGTPLPPSKIPRGTEHVLLVDDEAQVRALVEATLTDLGYTVVTCRDGGEALSVLEEQPGAFDIVVTDKTMPQMLGIVLAERIRDRWPALPVILCTGFQEPGTQDAARRAGIRRILDKPIRRAQLGHTLREVLDTAE